MEGIGPRGRSQAVDVERQSSKISEWCGSIRCMDKSEQPICRCHQMRRSLPGLIRRRSYSILALKLANRGEAHNPRRLSLCMPEELIPHSICLQNGLIKSDWFRSPVISPLEESMAFSTWVHISIVDAKRYVQPESSARVFNMVGALLPPLARTLKIASSPAHLFWKFVRAMQK